MKLAGHHSILRVAARSKGYPLLILSLCDHYGIPTVRLGRHTFLADEQVEEVCWRVLEWKRRPKLSRRSMGKRQLHSA